MPTYRANVHLGDKDPLVETDDISNGAITLDKLSDEVKSVLGSGGNGEGMGNVVMCSFFSEEPSSDPNVGKLGTYIYQNGKLAYKKGEEYANDQIVGVYNDAVLSNNDVYIDLSTGLTYRWDGSKMIDLLSPISNAEIDQIITQGEITSQDSRKDETNTSASVDETDNSPKSINSKSKIVVEELSPASRIKVLNINN